MKVQACVVFVFNANVISEERATNPISPPFALFSSWN